MTALKIIGVLVLLLVLLSLLHLEIRCSFGASLRLELRIGPIKRLLYPGQKRKKQNSAPGSSKVKTPGKKRPALPKPTCEEWREFASVAYRALRRTLQRTCRRLRIDPLECGLIFGGSDPAAVAQNFGRANAILWNVMPKAEELFSIPDPAIHLGMDYGAEEKIKAEGQIGLSLRICDLVVIALTLVWPLLGWYRKLKKAHKNDPVPESAAQTAQSTSSDQNSRSLSA